MAAPDEIIHQSLRLRIMAALYAARDLEQLDFAKLKALLNATDGNLGRHLATLENAGYVSSDKEFAGRKPRTRLNITAAGANAFRNHTNYLREIIEAAEPDAPAN
jgi:DNA-binding MarR family transcriptional regulator